MACETVIYVRPPPPSSVLSLSDTDGGGTEWRRFLECFRHAFVSEESSLDVLQESSSSVLFSPVQQFSTGTSPPLPLLENETDGEMRV
jgi:hypothetical protein